MTIAVLGASGLIGSEVAAWLAREGRRVISVARAFDAPPPPGTEAVEAAFVDATPAALADLLAAHEPSLVLNCVGVLQDGASGSTHDVHIAFVERLIAACRAQKRTPTLVHLSVPGDRQSDETAFAITKRRGEDLVRGSGLAHAILRPGFVVASGAYGGSALIRALAASPATLPRDDLERPFAAVAVTDIAKTVAWAADNDIDGETFELAHPGPATLGDVVEAHRSWLGGPRPFVAVPSFLTRLGSFAADMAGRLGWQAPVRSTAVAELRRGIECDPERWIARTGIRPTTISEALNERPATVADRWFAALYPLKALALATLAVFWTVSGLIALASFIEARAILVQAGFAPMIATAVTWISSLADIAIGMLIAWRRTARVGLWLGLAVSAFYLTGAAVLTPAMWLEPLGALVKTFPAMVLTLVCLATLRAR